MTKETARVVVAMVTIGLFLCVLSGLIGSHVTYSVYLRDGLFYGPRCQEWTLQALFEILAILAVAVGVWVYNEHRSAA
jgi:hypothetical protein